MAGKSKIEWTDETWNPIVGCSIVSPGCTNCYAMRDAWRKHHNPAIPYYHGLTKKVNGKPVWTGKLSLAPEKTIAAPLRWRDPRMVFVNSMGDLFHEDAPDEWIDQCFAVMALTPQHKYLILTKRPERMFHYFVNPRETEDHRSQMIGVALGNMLDGDWVWNEGRKWRSEIERLISIAHGFEPDSERLTQDELLPLPNVWLGISCEDQATADERIPLLLQTPAAIRFISYEPALGPVDLTRSMKWETEDDFGTSFPLTGDELSVVIRRVGGPRLDWIICGGESGPGARPMHPAWPRDVRDQCAKAGVAFFFKQWGEWAPCDAINVAREHALCGLMAASPHVERDWPRALAFFQKSKGIDGTAVLARVGKKSAGRLLDGVEHNEWPSVPAPKDKAA